MWHRGRLLWLALVLLSANGLSAQESQGTCDIGPVPGGRNPDFQQIGDAIHVSGRALYRCTNGVVFQADSAVSAYGRRYLIGNVIFEDPKQTIRAARLEYEERRGEVVAQGDVTVVDKKTGTRIRAPQGLTYFRGTRADPEARMEIFSGRPHLTLYRGDPPNRDTTDVDADRMRIIGERFFHGAGNVIIKRGELDARGGEAELIESGAKITLWRGAHIKSKDYTLDADSIYGEAEEDVFRLLRAFRSAKLDSEDMDVTAERLVIMLDSGVVNRLVAVSSRVAVGGQPAPQAHVIATDFELIADSIDALTPKQKLELVHAIGNAMGARQPDSLDLALPELIRRDWLRGDTVIAHFVEAPDSIKQRRAQSDSTFDRVLDRLIAAGAAQPATAMYRVREEADSTGQPQVNYIAAKRIVAVFKDGEVHEVEAKPEVRGINLQPIKKTTAPAAPPIRRDER